MSRGRAALGPVLGGVAAGALTGTTLWISQGVIALVDPDRGLRVGALPSWPWLAAAAVAGAAIAAIVAVPGPALVPLLVLSVLWLPWLPWRVPDAFLLWDGPVEGLVWLCAIGGVAWLSRPRLPWAWPAVTGMRAPIVAAVASGLVFAGAWTVIRPRVPSGDEPHYLIIAQSLLNDGDVRIENNHRAFQYLPYFDGVLKPDFMRRGTDRQIYSIHAPGTAVVVAPAFALGGYPGAALLVILLSAVGMGLVWRAAYLVSGSPAAAWVGWLAVTTSLPIVLHASTIYPDPLGAVIVMVGVLALVTLAGPPAATLRPWHWLGTGAALALLPWLHTRFAVLAGAIGLVLTLRLARRPGGWRDGLRLLVVPAVSAAGWLAYFWLIYGTPNPAAPYGRTTAGGFAWVPQGLAGLLLDQQFGLAVNAPVLLLGLAAFVPFVRRRPRLGAELLVVVLSYLVAVTTFPMWWGGTSAPARFAVAVLPLLGLPLAWTWATFPGLPRAVIGVLLGLSAAWSATVVGVDRGAYIHNGRDGYSLLLDWLTRTVDLTLAFPSVHRDGAMVAVFDTLVWVVTGTLVTAVAAAVARVARPSLARAAVWLAVPVAVMLGATVTWAGRDRAAHTPSTSQMWFLDRWFPAQAPLAVQLSPSRWLTAAEVPLRLSLGTSTRGALRPDAPLLQIPTPPAGDYDVFVEGADGLAGTVVVRLGRQDVPIETWTIEGRPAGYTGLALHLPLDAHSITVTGDDAARATIRQMTLKPRALALRTGRPPALRAARYGRTVIYALDDNAFLETGALWVRGTTASSVVVQGDVGTRPTVRLQAGPVDNVVTLTAGTWRTDLRIAADQRAEVTLPDAALAPATLSIASGSGFRPSEHSTTNGDVRWLGVYVTWPDGASAAPP